MVSHIGFLCEKNTVKTTPRVSMVRWPLTYFWVCLFFLMRPNLVFVSMPCKPRYNPLWPFGSWAIRRVVVGEGEIFHPRRWIRVVSFLHEQYHDHVKFHYFFAPVVSYEKNLQNVWFLRILDSFPRLRHHPWRPERLKWSLEALKPWNRSVWWWWWTGWFGLCSTRSCERHMGFMVKFLDLHRSGFALQITVMYFKKLEPCIILSRTKASQ